MKERTSFCARVGRCGVGVAAICLWAGVATAEQFPDFYYDTTQGVTTVYDGDLMDGILDLAHIDDRSFRVQRVPGATALGFYGMGSAALDAQLELLSFTGMGGPGDIASFGGTGLFGGFDFLAVDEFGETITGYLPEFLLVDRTDDPFIPGVVGTALVHGIEFSSTTFQGISVEDLLSTGSLFTFNMVIPGVTLYDYLDSGGLGGMAIPLDTLELRVVGIPAAPTGLLVAMGALAMGRRRRA